MPQQPSLQLSTRSVFRPLPLLVLGLGAWLGGAQAQLSTNTMAGSPAIGLVSAQAPAGGANPALAATGMGAAATAPTGTLALPQRLDAGAQDAPRTPLTALRPSQPEAPSQFQRFVQESTGKLLPIYGANLFENPLAYAADSVAVAPGEYLLGTGDEVRINISGAIDYAGSQTVDRNGQINLPKVG
ncbi:MAG: polysaccharide biosynthesis/export family protein, partial [Betaproteobacteria bacterium]